MKQQQTSNHPFNKRPVFTQIMAYFIVLTCLLTFTICILQNLSLPSHQIILAVFFYGSFCGIVIAWLTTSLTDPADSFTQNKIKKYPANTPQDTMLYYCRLCQTFVSGKSRHCKVCNICIDNFDHHCIWINHCVGVKNYRSFIVMILMTDSYFILYLISMSLLWNEGKWTGFLAQMITVWVVSFMVSIFTLLVVALTILHVFLIIKGMTTFQFMIIDKIRRIAPDTKEAIVQNDSINIDQNNYSQNDLKYNASSIEQNNGLKSKQVEETRIKDLLAININNRQSQGKIQQLISSQLKGGLKNKYQENVQKLSENETDQQLFYRKNKSLDYIFGKVQILQSKSNDILQVYQSNKINNQTAKNKKSRFFKNLN